MAIFKTGPMQWMPDKVVYGVKEALKDLRSANSKSKKRLLSRKGPISTTGSVKFTCNFEGFMPGDRMARPQAKRDWINAYMQLVLDKRCGRVDADETLVSLREKENQDGVDPWDTVPDDLANELFADEANDNQANDGGEVSGLESSMSQMNIQHRVSSSASG